MNRRPTDPQEGTNGEPGWRAGEPGRRAAQVRLAAEYVLPLRCDDDRGVEELTDYLGRLSRWLDVSVVDGSGPAAFAAHRRAWSDLITSSGLRHLPPRASGANGTVAGVVTGVGLARHERVVIADDDVRYDRRQLERLISELDLADLVHPQNVLLALRRRDLWQVRWDTAGTLLNRALGCDHPGTFALRRSLFQAMGGYSADVVFENLELARTMAAAGGREVHANDIFVPRYAPPAREFLEQRLRQAYDEFAQPLRLAGELSILPLTVAALYHRRPGAVVLGALASTVLAEYGRHRAGAAAVFSPAAVCWAPLWVGERAICVWIAAGYRLTGGMPHRGRRIRAAAHSSRQLRRIVRSNAQDGGPAPQ